MKKIFLCLAILISFFASGQIYQNPLLFGRNENRLNVYFALGIPNDTIPPPVQYQNRPHIAYKDGTLYLWSPSLVHFIPIGTGGGGGAIGTLQQVLTTGKSLTTNHTITINGHLFRIEGGEIQLVSNTDGSGNYSIMDVTPTNINLQGISTTSFASVGATTTYSTLNATKFSLPNTSAINVYTDSIAIQPYLGALSVSKIPYSSITPTMKLLYWDSASKRLKESNILDFPTFYTANGNIDGGVSGRVVGVKGQIFWTFNSVSGGEMAFTGNTGGVIVNHSFSSAHLWSTVAISSGYSSEFFNELSQVYIRHGGVSSGGNSIRMNDDLLELQSDATAGNRIKLDNNSTWIDMRADSISVLGKLNLSPLASVTDTTNFKPMVWNPATGQVRRSSYWYGSGGGGGGSTLLFGADVTYDSLWYLPTWTNAIVFKSLRIQAGATSSIVDTKVLTDSTISHTLALAGDLAAPGNNMYYGTNSSGVKSWYAFVGVTDGDKTDITVSSGGAVYTIDAQAVTFAKFQNITQARLLGRYTASNGPMQEITLGANLTLDPSTGVLSAASGGGGLSGLTTNNIPYANSATSIARTGASASLGLWTDQTNNRIGVNTSTPQYTLEVNGTFNSSLAISTASSLNASTSLNQSGVYTQATGSAPWFVSTMNWNGQGSFEWRGHTGALSLLKLDGTTTGSVIFPTLSGTGNAITHVDGSGTLVRGTIDPGNIVLTTGSYADPSHITSLSGNKITVQMSISKDASGLKLLNDAASPGNSMYYGTNGSGTKGYFALPTGSTPGDAAADGTTKGIATFVAADFNSTAGLISIDYTNAQKATTSTIGFLTATDWNTFNGKAPASGSANYINNTTSAQTADFNVTGSGTAATFKATSDQAFQYSPTSTYGYEITQRDALKVSNLPVASFRPTTANTNMAFDIMPNGTVGNFGTQPIAWLDVVDADIKTGQPAVNAARVGMTSTAGVFGTWAFNAATGKPVEIYSNGTKVIDVGMDATNTVTVSSRRFFITGAPAGDFVGSYLFNSDNTTENSDALFFIGNSTSGGRFGFMRWTNNAMTPGTQAYRNPNQLEILANTGNTNGLVLGVLQNTPIKFVQGAGASGAEIARFYDNGHFGVGLTAPSAWVNIRASTGAANTAPLKLTAGTNLTTPEDGAIEYNGTHFYVTIGSTRYQLDQQGGGGGGSVTTVSVVSANGFAGSVANASTTPAITITTTVTGILKGNGTAISAAVAGTDYVTPHTTLSGYGITDALNTSSTGTQAGFFGTLAVKDAVNPSHFMSIVSNEDLTQAVALNINLGNATRGLTLNANLTVSATATVSGTNTGDQTLSTLGAAGDPAGNGIVVRTAANTSTNRTLTGTANRIVITNGDGTGGNPTFDIGTDVVTLNATQSINNKFISLLAGTTLGAPLAFNSGPVLGVPVAGSMEYDGNAFYFTYNSTNRSVIPARSYVSVPSGTVALSSVTTAQSVFGSANDVISLAASTTYRFKAVYWISNGTVSHMTQTLFAYSGTMTSVAYTAIAVGTAANTAGTASITAITQMTATAVNAASTQAGVIIQLEGTFRTSTAGNLTPQIAFSVAPTGTNTVNANSFFEIWPVGTSSVTSVGNWN